MEQLPELKPLSDLNCPICGYLPSKTASFCTKCGTNLRGKNKVLDGLFGLCVGDALGVPVEFTPRQTLKESPITNMVGHGTHNQPPGTWSDDSSLAFCLAESLCLGFSLKDMADRFCSWLYEGYWAPRGKAFDVGNTTRHALYWLKQGEPLASAARKDENSNGNGSLMRILPLAYHLEGSEINEIFEKTHKVSCITHAHPRSQIACGIYIQLAINLLKGDKPRAAYEKTQATALNYYKKEPFVNELKHFSRVLEADIAELPEQEVNSRVYVIDTLEASLWCLLNNNSYAETVLSAVNLGGDTDTTGAVAGGLAGIYYGFENIPPHWINQIARKNEIIGLANHLNSKLYGA